jgi:tRNA pseudouridine13 synthase
MLIKVEPEDFVVIERTSWTPEPEGPVSVYELTKKKLDTFEAMRMVSSHTGIPLDKIRYVGLKDRQAVTTQLISIEGGQHIRGKIPGIQVKYLGRAKEPLSGAQLEGNRFEIVVRGLNKNSVDRLPERVAQIARHGVMDYFDDQRFGTLTAGQGMPGRAIVKGRYEEAVKLLLATPGKRDPVPEKRFKHLVKNTWGDWKRIAAKWGSRKGKSMVNYLRRNPDDFAGALQRMPGRERAIHIFAYQSLIWNNSLGHYLRAKLPPHRRSVTPYAGGELVWPNYQVDEDFPELVETWPLLDHTVKPEDDAVREALEKALGEEELTIPAFRIKNIDGCFFRHVERPMRIWPEDLRVVMEPTEDDRNPGKLKVGLHFALPSGAYATLVLRRLFRGEPRRGDVVAREREVRSRRKEKQRKRQGKAKKRAKQKSKKRKGT